jgi:peptidoglycan/LPS O-acetylase OafA/YrhL
MYELYSTKEKIYFFACGLIIALSIAWVTYLFFETRVERMAWDSEFTTPSEFWSEVPKWEWKKTT